MIKTEYKPVIVPIKPTYIGDLQDRYHYLYKRVMIYDPFYNPSLYNLNSFFKEVYGDSLKDLITSGVNLLNKVKK